MSTKRFDYIDYAKGFAILALIFCHTNPGEGINTWIFGFHMPIFFIIGGMIMALKSEREPMQWDTITKLLSRRLNNLILPYIIFCLILTVFYGCMSFLSGNGFSISTNLIRTFTFQGIDSLWFIPCYFWSEILCAIILVVQRKNTVPLLYLSLLLGIIMMAYNPSEANDTIRYFMKILVSLSFFSSGILIIKYHILLKFQIVHSFVILLITSFITIWSGFSAIGSLEFPKGVLYFFTSAFMSSAILTLFDHLRTENKATSLLRIFGQFSIVVLCTNNILIEIIRLLDYKVTGNFLLSHGLLGSCLFFIILTALEFVLIKISQGPCGIIFGRK